MADPETGDAAETTEVTPAAAAVVMPPSAEEVAPDPEPPTDTEPPAQSLRDHFVPSNEKDDPEMFL